ncbi:hypothetical protein H5T51_03175, partial [Candidatus Bathyarchaeota archaeon]|nr:hypothetical protein [Candidatus Bathyarchaeota archaeon]
MSSKIPVERLCEEPYRMVICYPRPSIDELEKRLKELRRLGVTAIEFIGGKKVAD